MSIKQPRFFVENLDPAGTVMVMDDEAHHLIHVLRAKIGDQIAVFDGSGYEAWGQIAQVTKKHVALEILSHEWIDREIPCRLTLAVSLPKGDRQKILVEKLVELGVSELIPVVSERSVAQPTDNALERLKKSVIAASKQCGRNRLMTIAEPMRLTELWARGTDELRLICCPGASQKIREFVDRNQPAVAVVGPEGGLTQSEEQAAFELGWQPVQLGPALLRVETAAIYVASILGQ